MVSNQAYSAPGIASMSQTTSYGNLEKARLTYFCSLNCNNFPAGSPCTLTTYFGGAVVKTLVLGQSDFQRWIGPEVVEDLQLGENKAVELSWVCQTPTGSQGSSAIILDDFSLTSM
jgi:hypothetical protein